MRTFRRFAVLLLLGLVFTAPWASASNLREKPAPGKNRNSPQVSVSPFALLGMFLTEIWRDAVKTSCTIDPLGRCMSITTPSADVDVLGRPVPANGPGYQ